MENILPPNFRPCKAGCPIACAGHGPTSLEPRPDLCPREESNFDYKIRNLASYPLNDEGKRNRMSF